MKSHLLSGSLCAALILLPSAALAAPAATTAATPRNDEGAAVSDRAAAEDSFFDQAGVRELIFDESDTVEGETLLPNGVNVTGRIAEDHANMIGIRGQFINQLIWLSNDI